MALTPLEEKLKEAGKLYLENDEARRLIGSSSDYSLSFDATEQHVRLGVQAFLVHFGVEHSESSSTVELIAALRDVVASRPPELKDDAHLQLMLKSVDDLEQTLRDINYFRQGFGALSDRGMPADMRMRRPGPVGSVPFNAFKTLLVYMRGTNARQREERLQRQALLQHLGKRKELDFPKIYDRIVKELRKDQEIDDFMSAVIRACRSQVRRKAWDSFIDLPYQEDVSRSSRRVLDIIISEPPASELIGFLFLIGNPYRDGEPVADAYFSASDRYEPSEEWAGMHMTYEPRQSFLGSDVLAAIYKAADATELGNMAEYPLELAYTAFLARGSVQLYKREMGTASVGVSAGFQSGDLIHLGLV
jgi:hypothetical protein